MKIWFRSLISRKNLGRDTAYALLIAIGFSAFIYIAHWGYELPLFNTLAGLAAIYGLLTQTRRTVILSGFFIGLLWFYWIGFSFRYYGLGWMVPVISVGFGLIYALIFGMMAISRNAFYRAAVLFAIGFFEPFDFNWMLPELLFIHSWLGVAKWQFALALSSLALFAQLHRPWRYGALLLLLGALDVSDHTPKPLPPLSIKLAEAELPQDEKWVPSNRERIIDANFKAIDNAAARGHDLVILHESALPLFLNRRPDLLEQLRLRSHKIAIVIGALFYEDGKNYNVTYCFENGTVQIAKKMVLVPFGEYIPLPKFLHRIINETFFDGASDYVGSDTPTTFTIAGIAFRNAICYEATCPELFAGDPEYMIAISNNAWFTPSIEPTLQRLLMEYFSRRHGTVILHSANMAGTGIIR